MKRVLFIELVTLSMTAENFVSIKKYDNLQESILS